MSGVTLDSVPAGGADRATGDPLIEVRGLKVELGQRGRRVQALRGVDLSLRAGECLAIVGESGSGKSVLARTLVGLTGARPRVEAERLEIAGQDLRRLDARGWRRLRGGQVGLVFQDALVALDPLRRVGHEVADAALLHRTVERRGIGAHVHDLLGRVGIPDPARRARQYPHELSGGLRQRVLIASALSAGPGIIIADEPTTALDATVQLQVLGVIARLKAEGAGVILISHDLGVVASVADRVMVMRNGELLETGAVAEVIGAARHPYTLELIAAAPSLAAARARPDPAAPTTAPVIEVNDLRRSFAGQSGPLVALDGISLTVRAGESVGVVGESGSGKSTLARVIMGVERADSGKVRISRRDGGPVPAGIGRRARILQMIQQSTAGAFDPRATMGEALHEVLGVTGDRRGGAGRIATMLDRVHLSGAILPRLPHELSGGQRQRVAIARALLLSPEILVCDEPVSALDVTVQAGVLRLLKELRNDLGLTLLFISHDLGVVGELCDRVAVMHRGRIVEEGAVPATFRAPASPYARDLLQAVPTLDHLRAPPFSQPTDAV